MTVKELKEKLSQYNENLPIYVYDYHFEMMSTLDGSKQCNDKVILGFWNL